MKTSLVVGMGIGKLYVEVLKNLGHKVFTVDTNSDVGADYINITDAMRENVSFDTVHICTPNFTHVKIARVLAPISKIIFIEKPGVATSDAWEQLCKDYPNTRFMMVKNNMWRDNIDEMRTLAEASKYVYFNWFNNNRVPNPGTWFTTKSLAYGGVSRDLVPHLLSLFIALNPKYDSAIEARRVVKQNWTLKDVSNTDYGVVNKDGTYDVDDECMIQFEDGRYWEVAADWRTLDEDLRNIEFYADNGECTSIELGLCPEDAYQRMIADAVANIDNDAFWQKQYEYDMWIHKKIENI